MKLKISEIDRIYDRIYLIGKQRCFSESQSQTKVFLSHKHDDKKALFAIKDILEKCGARPYIDWMDEDMQHQTNAATASTIKRKIQACDSFILVATDGAIDSKWCNWELGYGDAYKYKKHHIALFPVEKDNELWSGNEYMQLYPVIEKLSQTEAKRKGIVFPYLGKEDYYVIYNKQKVIPLKEWLQDSNINE
ncbi:MAG: toll/interleukin-1 receptor domain-containing protein [Prevotella sp.]|nr:toll/interleukin-1 receptor domain-containing protein [Prevotella sp.]